MVGLVFLALSALKFVVIADAILSWVMSAEQFPRSLTLQITDPLYAPIRALIGPDKTGGIDISPLAMLLLLNFMEKMLPHGQ
jgi:YggT family protein